VHEGAQQLAQAFVALFTPSDFTRWVKFSNMFFRTHQASETVDEFIVQTPKLAGPVKLTDETLIRYAV